MHGARGSQPPHTCLRADAAASPEGTGPGPILPLSSRHSLVGEGTWERERKGGHLGYPSPPSLSGNPISMAACRCPPPPTPHSLKVPPAGCLGRPGNRTIPVTWGLQDRGPESQVSALREWWDLASKPGGGPPASHRALGLPSKFPGSAPLPGQAPPAPRAPCLPVPAGTAPGGAQAVRG